MISEESKKVDSSESVVVGPTTLEEANRTSMKGTELGETLRLHSSPAARRPLSHDDCNKTD